MRAPLTLTALLAIFSNLTGAAGGMDDVPVIPPKDHKVTMAFVRPLVIPPAYLRLRIDPALVARPGSPKPPKFIKMENLWDEKEMEEPAAKKVPLFFYPKPNENMP